MLSLLWKSISLQVHFKDKVAPNISVCWKYFCLLEIFLSAEECSSLSPRPLWSLWSLSFWSLCCSDHQNHHQCQRINKLQHSDALKHYEAVFVKSGQKVICFETLSQIDWKSTKQLILAILFLTQKENRWSMHWTVLSGKSRSLSTSNCTLSSSITVSARSISLSVNRRPPRNELCWEHSYEGLKTKPNFDVDWSNRIDNLCWFCGGIQ